MYNSIKYFLSYLKKLFIFQHLKHGSMRRGGGGGSNDVCHVTVTMTDYASLYQYAVKAHTSLAPLSRFRRSHITTAHEQQCCRFQSYAKTAIATEIYKQNWQSVNTFLGSTTTDHVITACDVWL